MKHQSRPAIFQSCSVICANLQSFIETHRLDRVSCFSIVRSQKTGFVVALSHVLFYWKESHFNGALYSLEKNNFCFSWFQLISPDRIVSLYKRLRGRLLIERSETRCQNHSFTISAHFSAISKIYRSTILQLSNKPQSAPLLCPCMDGWTAGWKQPSEKGSARLDITETKRIDSSMLKSVTNNSKVIIILFYVKGRKQRPENIKEV